MKKLLAATLLASAAMAQDCNTANLTLSHTSSNLVKFNQGFIFGPRAPTSLDLAVISMDNIGCKGVSAAVYGWNYLNAKAGLVETDFGGSISFSPSKKTNLTIGFDNWGYWQFNEDDNQSVSIALTHVLPGGFQGKIAYRNLNVKRAANGHNMEYALAKPLLRMSARGHDLQVTALGSVVATKNYFGATGLPAYSEAGVRATLRKGNVSYFGQASIGRAKGFSYKNVPVVSAGVEYVLRLK